MFIDSYKYVISTDVFFRLVYTSIVLFWVLSYLSLSLSLLTGVNYFLSLALMFCLIFTKKINQSYIGMFVIIYSLLILLIFFISRIYYLTPSLSALTIILNLWIGLGLCFYGVYFRAIKALHILFCLYVIFLILFLDVAPANVMRNSYNHISIVAIGLLVLSNLNYSYKNRNFILIQIYLTFAVCLISLGRSGILSSLFLTISSSLYFINISNMSRFKKRVFRTIFYLGMALGIILFLNSDFALRFIASAINLAGREEIFLNYFSMMGPKELFIGHDVTFTRVFIDPKLSIHNSYLGMHQGAGIFGIGLLILILLTLPIMLKQNFVHFSLYLTILLRGFTDNIIYTNSFLYGAIVTAYILYTFLKAKTDRI
jgi:hypothetical protein